MKVAILSFESCELPIGLKLNIDGQVYKLIRGEDDLIVWRAHCPDCGGAFEAKTTRSFSNFTRRCQVHRKSGARVKDTRLCAEPS